MLLVRDILIHTSPIRTNHFSAALCLVLLRLDHPTKLFKFGGYEIVEEVVDLGSGALTSRLVRTKYIKLDHLSSALFLRLLIRIRD